jgi:hypothetical protein
MGNPLSPAPAQPSLVTTPKPFSMPGLKELLIGGVGSGKTTSIKTWIEAGITPFCIFTEPSYEVIGDVGCDKLHLTYIGATTPSWAQMLDSAKKINSYDLKTLSGLSDIKKGEYHEFMDVLVALSNFTCMRCGESFGSVDSWNTDRVLVLDSLSGLNIMAMNLVVGSKPVKSMSDWGIAMDNEERLLQKLTCDVRCHVQVNAHPERELDEVTGQSFVSVAVLGRKLAPRLPRFFSDVIFSSQKQGTFSWSTITSNTDLKARNLPHADNLPQSFAPLVEIWKSRGGQILATE